MNTKQNELFDQLRNLIAQLGQDGGKISPSIYDTAQRLRFYPPVEGVEPGLAWLLEHQRADGGWCDPAVPAARDASTLAAILALKQVRRDRAAQRAIEAGLAFLRVQAPQWAGIPLDGLPIAVEVILPRLIAEANEAGLAIDPTPYARLYALGQKKLQILQQLNIGAGSAPTYSWEAYGTEPAPELLDRMDSVGHSPAATARWLQLAAGRSDLAQATERAVAYLQRAHEATDCQVPGVVPVAYPITGFELTYGPYAMLLTGQIEETEYRSCVKPIVRELLLTIQAENGLNFGDGFVPDVDGTSVGMAVLLSQVVPVEPEYIMQFYQREHFFTFAYELNPSVFSNAHAVYALALADKRISSAEKFLLDRQEADGRWPADKWHGAWRYTTLEVASALLATGNYAAVHRATQAFVDDQVPAGYWAIDDRPSVLETAYGIIMLALAQRCPGIPDYTDALHRAVQWYLNTDHAVYPEDLRWISKEMYSARRVDRSYKLCAHWIAHNHAQFAPCDATREKLGRIQPVLTS